MGDGGWLSQLSCPSYGTTLNCTPRILHSDNLYDNPFLVSSTSCISYFYHCYDKISDKSNLNKNLFIVAHSLWVQSVMVEKTCWREWLLLLWQKCVDYSVSTVREQRERNVHIQLYFPFLFGSGPQPAGWRCPHLGWVFPPQLNLFGNTPMDTSREIFTWWF